jgi:ubiquinone/menaquinone biosynthesis C-methylase UbiE
VTPSTRCNRATYFAQPPTVAFADCTRTVDMNVAMQVLLGPPFSQCRRHRRERFETWLADRGAAEIVGLVRGEHRRPVALRFASDSFGMVDLRARAVRPSEDDGGRQVRCEIRTIQRHDEYDRRFETEARRQLAWESYARSYDRVLPAMPYYREVVARHVRAMTRPGIARVLDVGAGTGNVAVEVARAGRTVVAIDVSGAMLEQLRAKVEPALAQRIEILEENAEWLADWPGETYDGVTILLVLYDAERPQIVLREAMRLLHPGGWLVVTEPKRQFRIAELLNAVEEQMRQQGTWHALRDDWARVCDANRELSPERRPGRMFVDDIVATLRREGFADVDVEDSHFGSCATVRARRREDRTTLG